MRLLTFICLFSFCYSLEAQKSNETPPEDPITAQLIQEGKKRLHIQDLDMAWAFFDSAANRPYNQSTTAAMYLCGLTHFYSGEYDQAIRQFDLLIRQHPKSVYVEEARFHEAIIHLKDSALTNQWKGMDTLSSLASFSFNPELQKEALAHLKRFCFYESELPLLEAYYELDSSEFRVLIMEALVYRLVQEDMGRRAKRIYRNWLKEKNPPSPFVSRLFDPRRPGRSQEKETIKIAVFLPLNLQLLTDSIVLDTTGQVQIPGKSKLAMEFYEGLEMALEDSADYWGKQFVLKVFDSRRDSQMVRDQLRDLDNFYPDLVIGDIYNKQSRIISEWAEFTATPQIIPLSPSVSLVENKDYVFLATPDVVAHGATMAEYARDSLKLNRVAVWTHQMRSTELMAQAFIDRFYELGGESVRIPVDSTYDSAKVVIPDLVRSMKLQQIDGVYIPILNQEETAGLIVSQISALELPVKIMGGPHFWRRYSNIDYDLKDKYELVFSTSFLLDKEEDAYQAFFRNYLKNYHIPPSEYNTQGYDMGLYVRHLMTHYQPKMMSLASYVRSHPPFRSLHLEYAFDKTQSNQFVNLGMFKDGKIVKVNRTKPLELKEAGEVRN